MLGLRGFTLHKWFPNEVDVTDEILSNNVLGVTWFSVKERMYLKFLFVILKMRWSKNSQNDWFYVKYL